MATLEDTCAKMIVRLREIAQSRSKRGAHRAACVYLVMMGLGACVQAASQWAIDPAPPCEAPPWTALVWTVLAFAFALAFTEYAGNPEKLARRMETFVMTADYWSTNEREYRMRRLFDEYDLIVNSI